MWPKNRAEMLLVLKLALAGSIPLAFIMVQVYPAWVLRAAIAAAVVVSAIIINCVEGDVFNNGFCTGLLMGLFQTLFMLFFWDRFATNSYAASSPDITTASVFCQSKLVLFVAGLGVAVIYGIQIGLISWAYYRIMGLFIHAAPDDPQIDESHLYC